uniref:hypothetical protein n=1 Tax=Pseudoduganella sp. OTU4001 TaxID=3043854 RepID=UPI00313D7DD0
MDLLWFIVLCVVARWAWVARRDARWAREHTLQLQVELVGMEDKLASMERQLARQAVADAPAPAAA